MSTTFVGSVTSNPVVRKFRGKYRYVFLDVGNFGSRRFDVVGGEPRCSHRWLGGDQKCVSCGATVWHLGREASDDRFNRSMMMVLQMYNPWGLFVVPGHGHPFLDKYEHNLYPDSWRLCREKYVVDGRKFDCISRTGKLPQSVYFNGSVLWVNPSKLDFLKYGCDYVLCGNHVSPGLFEES